MPARGRLGFQQLSDLHLLLRILQARFYSLTAKGLKQLAFEEESWAKLTEGVGPLPHGAGGGGIASPGLTC